MESTVFPLIEAAIEFAEEDPRIEVLWLYGSRARDAAQESSDYDFAVAFNTFPDDPWEKRLQPELVALDWSKRLAVPDDLLSVADINNIPLTLAFNVITNGKVLLAKSRLRLAREENRITSQWEIDHEYHKEHFG